jgi:hypothetical protein
MKKLYIFLLISVFVLNGCFGSDEPEIQTPQFEGFNTYEAPSFSIAVPERWDVIEQRDFTDDIPSQTQVIFKNNIKNDKFTANANVTKQLLNEAMTSQEFARTEIAGHKSTLLNYREISRNDEFKVIVGDKVHNSIFILFEGKQAENQPMIRVVQTFAVNGADAYTVTAAYLKETEDELLEETSKNIIETFKVK